MRLITVLDKKNYDATLPISKRTAARAIIKIDGKLALVKSEVEGYYKFPGGGVEKGETLVQALVREAREEVGLIVDESTISEYGETVELRKNVSKEFGECIFEHTSYYFTCDVCGAASQMLDVEEEALKFVYELVDAQTAIAQNEKVMNKYYSTNIIRETEVLRDVVKNLAIK